MTRYALTLSYNGSAFFGFQKQAAGIPTIQTALEHALAQIAGESIAITAAGRTDTGVHATERAFARGHRGAARPSGCARFSRAV